MFCLDMLKIVLEFVFENDVYEDIVFKFFEYFFYIVDVMNYLGFGGI